MAYVYESIQSGIFNFTPPGTDKTVKLLAGSQVVVNQLLTGSYLRVLKFVKEIPDTVEETKVENKQQAKVADKITKVEETTDVKTDSVEVSVSDAIVANQEQQVEVKPIVNNKQKKK